MSVSTNIINPGQPSLPIQTNSVNISIDPPQIPQTTQTPQNVKSIEDIVNDKLAELKKNNRAFPAALRFDVFKSLLKSHPDAPEKATSKLVREIFDHDLAFLKNSVQKWKTKTDQATKALKNIDEFMSKQKLSVEMSFQEHAYLCFCLSALISGKEIDQLDAEYRKQLHTMVRGVIHPLGEWTLKNVLEDQSYAKFIFHVSATGLASVELINDMTSFRLDENSPFCAVRLAAVACGEYVGFDGIEDCGSLDVLIHDFIHAGFLKYAHETNPKRYLELLEKMGQILKKIRSDETLKNDPELLQQVEAAFFMWTHEYTTSVFADGWPRGVPEPKWFLGGQHASGPQILLRLASKFKLIPPLFSKEIENEGGMLKSLGLDVKGVDNEDMSDHDKVVEVMSHFHLGYKYLHENFGDFYGSRSAVRVVVSRIYQKMKNFISNIFTDPFKRFKMTPVNEVPEDVMF